MKRSASRILATHTGSLPRSPELQELLRLREDQQAFDAASFHASVRDAMGDILDRQQNAVTQTHMSSRNMPQPACTGPVAWKDCPAVERDIANLREVSTGSDCGFGTSVWGRKVEANIAWAKLASMAEGARLATRELWQRPG